MRYCSRARWVVQWPRWILLITLLALLLTYVPIRSSDRSARTLPLHQRIGRRRPITVKRTDSLSSGIRRPPQAARVYVDTPDSLKKIVDDYEPKESKIVEDILKNVKPEDATFENVVLPYIQHEQQHLLDTVNINLYKYVSQKPELQNITAPLQAQIANVSQKTYVNEDLFNLVNTTYFKQYNDTKLTLEDQKLLESYWNTFRGTGLYVEKGEKRDRYNNISVELQTVVAEFNQGLVDDRTLSWFTREELNGTREDTLSSLEKGTGENEGKLKLDYQSETDYSTVSDYCTNETTRKTISYVYNNRVPDNVERLKTAAGLRDELARMLNASSWAESVISGYMAETPENVHKLLDDVYDKLVPARGKKLDHLKELKKNETGNADHFFLWDNGYYVTSSYRDEYNVDVDKVKEYFPSTLVVLNVLDLYSTLFHLHFVKIEGKDRDDLSPTGKGEDLTWQSDVELYAVWDSDSINGYADEGGEFVGYLYLDLFEREGKTPGAFTLPIDNGFKNKDGTRHYPTCVLVCNFRQSTSDNPSLLRRYDVETIMHELGHGMHQLTSRTTYMRFHGPLGTPPDFFEAPSQMMENWAFEPAILKKFSKHWSYLSDEYKIAWQKAQNDSNAVQPPEKMTDDLIQDIRRIRNAYAVNGELRQVSIADYDLKIHELKSHEDAAKLDVTELYNVGYKNFTGLDGPEVLGEGFNWGHPQTQFRHLMGGYEGGFYSYLWSRVYAKDWFYFAFKNDPFNGTAGYKFRKTILEPGGTKNFTEIIMDFLGREPSNQAYYDDLELDGIVRD